MFYIADNSGNYYGEYQKYEKAKAQLADILAERPELEAYELEILVPDASEVAERMKGKSEWDITDCCELCNLAGLKEEWAKADGENFEAVLSKAAEILGVDIF